MLMNSKALVCQAFVLSKTLRAFSAKSQNVRVTEQKVKVGKYDINYAKSSIEGETPSKTLICLPGALGMELEL
jgi:hypothetical protein